MGAASLIRSIQSSIPYAAYHLWAPDIFQFKGGIQVYSAFLLHALQAIAPEQQYDVFLKHDRQVANHRSFAQQTRFHCSGRWSLRMRTAIFASQLIGYGLWQRPDLVIATHINFAPAAAWLKRLTNAPYWVVAHGIEAWHIQRPALRNALCRADKILAVSHYTRQRLLREQALEPSNVVVLPNTFDSERFHITDKPDYLLKRYQLRADQPVILTVARLSRKERSKGYDQVLEALPKIRVNLPAIHYVIVGKGDDRLRIEQKISDLGLQDCVSLAGFVPDEELCHYYNLCDLLAMPSTGEGFGIVYLEAMACGKPTLAGNQDGAVDALCGGELGALVDPENIEEIAQTIVQLLQGTYPNALIYQPELLRQAVLATFGFERFTATLAGHLTEMAEVSFP